MAAPRKLKPRHSYFTETEPSSWNIINFLDSELIRHGTTHFSFDTSLGDWNSSLRILSQSGTPSQKTIATTKLSHYRDHPGCLSDKTLAMNWRDRKKRRKLNQGEPKHVQHNYHGQVNQFIGDAINSTVNFDRAGPFHITPSTPDGNSCRPSPFPETPLPSTPHSKSEHSLKPDDALKHGDNNKPDENLKPAVDLKPDGSLKSDGNLKPTDDIQPEDDTLEDDPNLNSESRLQLLCLSLQELRNSFHDTLVLPSGRVLEDCFLSYASSLLQLDPVHGFIADEKLLSTMDEPDRTTVLSRVLPLPAFPEALDRALRMCTGVPVPTITRCREVAGDAVDRDLLWISRVLEHMVELITHGLLLLDLGEGTFDSTVNPVLWDNYFLDLPGLLLRRKEITIPSMQHEPYQYFVSDPRFDGVFRTHSSARKSSYELALFEVSGRYDGTKARKWKRDKAKLLAGCRAMLYRLKELVDHDMETVRRLRVIGVLQAGLHSQLLVMQFVNANVLYVREGSVWELPSTLEGLGELSNVVAVVWKAKRIVRETADVVRAYLEVGGRKNTKRTAEDFL